MFKNGRDVALRDVVNEYGGDGLGLGLEALEVFSNLNDPMKVVSFGRWLTSVCHSAGSPIRLTLLCIQWDPVILLSRL